MPLLQAYGINPQQAAGQPLWKALADAHVEMKDFLRALDEIDWDTEHSAGREHGVKDRSPEGH